MATKTQARGRASVVSEKPDDSRVQVLWVVGLVVYSIAKLAEGFPYRMRPRLPLASSVASSRASCPTTTARPERAGWPVSDEPSALVTLNGRGFNGTNADCWFASALFRTQD